ncbi:helix-turn-helix domain-containing protein [Agrobacterium sp. 22-209-1]
MSLGSIIRDSRKAKGLTQGEVAEKLGVSVQAVSQWERDATVPGAMNLIELKEFLGFSLDTPITARDMLMYLPDPIISTASGRRQPVVAPLVNWNQPPEKWGELNTFESWGTEDEVEDPRDYLSIHWKPVGDVWALEYKGFTMRPAFETGDIVIIDTGRAPEKGDFVVAKIDKHSAATLAVYVPMGLDKRRAPIFELRFLNDKERKPERVDGENTGYVIGVVREQRRFYRTS